MGSEDRCPVRVNNQGEHHNATEDHWRRFGALRRVCRL